MRYLDNISIAKSALFLQLAVAVAFTIALWLGEDGDRVENGDLVNHLIMSSWIALPNLTLAVTGVFALGVGGRFVAGAITFVGASTLLLVTLLYGATIAGEPFLPEAGVMLAVFPLYVWPLALMAAIVSVIAFARRRFVDHRRLSGNDS